LIFNRLLCFAINATNNACQVAQLKWVWYIWLRFPALYAACWPSSSTSCCQWQPTGSLVPVSSICT